MFFDPEIYDLTQPGTFLGDIEWYQRKAAEYGGPVLELGAGTGRITIPIAKAGIQISAVEIDPAMVQKLQEKVDALGTGVSSHVKASVGDMRTFKLDERFALIIIPFHAFLHNQTTEDQRQCLQRIREHLRPGGVLAFNVAYPSLNYMSQHAGPLEGVWRWSQTEDLPDGSYAVYSEALRYDTVRQRVMPMIRTDFYSASGDFQRSKMCRLDLAYLYPADVTRLLQEANFEVIRMSGDYNDGPLENSSNELVIEARLSK